MPQKKVTLTNRQIRFANVLVSQGRRGHDFSDVIRRWVDLGIEEYIRLGWLTESDGGPFAEVVDDEPDSGG